MTAPPRTPSSPPDALAGTVPTAGTRHRGLGALGLRLAVRLLLSVPYGWRAGLAARLFSGPGRQRSRTGRAIRDAIAARLPDRAPEAEALAAEVLGNIARTQIEVLSGAPFARATADAPITGPGWPVLQAAHAAGRPVVLLMAHFGNPTAVGAALIARGIEVGSVYNPLPVPALDAIYVDAMQHYTRPLFTTDRAGMVAMMRQLRAGRMLNIAFDLERPGGVELDFLGRPTRTQLSMAELALRHDAPLIPAYGLRRPDGGFEIRMDAPIPPGSPTSMMQGASDSLAAMVRAHPGQWLWWHRRWKTPPSSQGDGPDPAGATGD